MGGQLETIQEFSPRSTLQEGIIHLNPKLHALQKKKNHLQALILCFLEQN